MASIKEIRSHIKSVEQTLKITNAMYFISSSNLRRAKKHLDDVLPYFNKIISTIADILDHTQTFDFVYFDRRPQIQARDRKIGYIVMTGDKGLAGAYNHNVLKLAEEQLKKSDVYKIFPVGIVGQMHFKEHGFKTEGNGYMAQNPTVQRAQELSIDMVNRFVSGELDEVHVIYTEMKTALSLQVRQFKLLPLERESFPTPPGDAGGYKRVVNYVPSEEDVLDTLVPTYAKGLVFGAMVESFCAEQCARMMAMEASSNNAKDMIKSLSLTYNRARQAAITQEITEIAGGAQSLL